MSQAFFEQLHQRGFKPKTIQQIAEEGKQTDPLEGNQNAPESGAFPFYSATEQLRTKRFDQFTDEELRAARRFIEQMNWRVGLRKTRRHKASRGGTRLDLSRVMRKNLNYGAEIYDIPARVRKFKPRPSSFWRTLAARWNATRGWSCILFTR